jgi:hypothetical protein
LKEINKEDYMTMLKLGKKKVLKRSRHKFFLMEDETLLNNKTNNFKNKNKGR